MGIGSPMRQELQKTHLMVLAVLQPTKLTVQGLLCQSVRGHSLTNTAPRTDGRANPIVEPVRFSPIRSSESSSERSNAHRIRPPTYCFCVQKWTVGAQRRNTPLNAILKANTTRRLMWPLRIGGRSTCMRWYPTWDTAESLRCHTKRYFTLLPDGSLESLPR